MVPVILVLGFVLFFLFVAWGSQEQKKNEARIKEVMDAIGISLDDRLFVAKYLSGHPEIDSPIPSLSILHHSGYIELYFIPFGLLKGDPVNHGKIPIASIKQILAEDQTTVEKRITIGRLLAVGVFALAWKKKKKEELAYLIIEWNDGKFDHETIFEFEGPGAMQNANTARNKLIKAVR